MSFQEYEPIPPRKFTFQRFEIDARPHENGLSVTYEVTRLDEPEDDLYLDGFVKWDGCSNWTFHRENHMKHFCGKEQVQEMTRLLEYLYDEAPGFIPGWSGD